MCFLHLWQISLNKISVPPYLSGFSHQTFLKKSHAPLPSEMDHLWPIENMHEDSRNSLLSGKFKSDPSTNHLTLGQKPLITSPAFLFCFTSASASFVLRIAYQLEFYISTEREQRWPGLNPLFIQMRKSRPKEGRSHSRGENPQLEPF